MINAMAARKRNRLFRNNQLIQENVSLVQLNKIVRKDDREWRKLGNESARYRFEQEGKEAKTTELKRREIKWT